ncbi:hypothetical protein V8C86DRAFT_2565408 [Haematococcus lacustris]
MLRCFGASAQYAQTSTVPKCGAALVVEGVFYPLHPGCNIIANPLSSEDVPLPPWQQSDMQAMERHRQVQQAARVGQWQQHLPHEKVHGIFVPGTRCPDHARIFISGPPGHVKHTLQALKDDVCLLPPGTDSQALPLRMFDRTLLTAPTWIQLGRLQACILFQAASPDSKALLAQPHASILLPPPDSSAGKQLEEEGAGPTRQCTSRSGQEQGWVDAQISVHLTPSLAPVPRPSLEAPRPPAPAPAPTAAGAWPLTQPQEGVTGALPGSSLLQAVDQHNQAWVCNRSLRPSVSLQGAAQRVSLEQQRQQQRRSLEQQLRVSLDLAASGASVTTSQVLMHELRQQQRRSLDAQREQQRRSIEQQRRSLEVQLCQPPGVPMASVPEVPLTVLASSLYGGPSPPLPAPPPAHQPASTPAPAAGPMWVSSQMRPPHHLPAPPPSAPLAVKVQQLRLRQQLVMMQMH